MSLYSHGYSAAKRFKLPRRPYFLRNAKNFFRMICTLIIVLVLFSSARAQNEEVDQVYNSRAKGATVRQRSLKSVEYKNGLIFVQMGKAIISPESRLSKIVYTPCDILENISDVKKLLSIHNATCNIKVKDAKEQNERMESMGAAYVDEEENFILLNTRESWTRSKVMCEEMGFKLPRLKNNNEKRDLETLLERNKDLEKEVESTSGMMIIPAGIELDNRHNELVDSNDKEHL